MTIEGILTDSPGAVNPDALVAEMFTAEGASLVRLARIFCDDRNAAEDLVQEAFIRLHRSAGSIRDLGRAPAFLRSIVINLARDHNRRGLMSMRHRNTAEPAPPGPREPDEATVAHEASHAVLEALRLLPERQRACLVLHYYDDLPIADVAETLSISTNSVKTHCRRGLASLEARLGEAR